MDTRYGEHLHPIKDVAIYIRKSRGDEEKDLKKHRLELTTLCKKNNWSYVEYKEIGTSDSIDLRPEMVRLLKDVQDELYDAVVVIDIDRLSRGDEEDRGRYLNIFRETETYIVTPEKIYDLDDDNDDLHISVKGLLAREEYKSIKKRLRRGKILGSRQGNWTNGIPPFPYEYERWKDKYNEKGLVINDEKLVVYRFIVENFIENNYSMSHITWLLNKKGVKSPRGGMWHTRTVSRILIDETGLGRIISNKYKTKYHKGVKTQSVDIPKSEWVVVENRHESCKTQEEHEKILLMLAKNSKSNSMSRRKLKPLTGLVECAICGHTMTIQVRHNRNNQEALKPCWYKNEHGDLCSNGGCYTLIIYDAIDKQLKEHEEKLIRELNNDEGINTDKIQQKIDIQLNAIKVKEKALEKIYIAYEDDIYDLNTFRIRKEKVEGELNKLTDELEVLQIELKNTESMNNYERINYIEEFKKQMQNEDISDEDKNALYKTIIDRIIFKRVDDQIEIDVNFL